KALRRIHPPSEEHVLRSRKIAGSLGRGPYELSELAGPELLTARLHASLDRPHRRQHIGFLGVADGGLHLRDLPESCERLRRRHAKHVPYAPHAFLELAATFGYREGTHGLGEVRVGRRADEEA